MNSGDRIDVSPSGMRLHAPPVFVLDLDSARWHFANRPGIPLIGVAIERRVAAPLVSVQDAFDFFSTKTRLALVPRETLDKFVGIARELRTNLTEWLTELGSDDSDADKNNRDDIEKFDSALSTLEKEIR